MKKNWTLRVGVILAALTLMTSCFVGGTFAKYTTAGEGIDSARVAKFGVTVTASGSTFAKEYATDNGTVVGAIAKSVVSSNDDKLVAPGTEGNMAAVTIAGTPEVAVEVSYTADVVLSNNWVGNDGSYYCPLNITVGGTTLKGADYASTTEFETAIEDAVKAYTKQYAPNTDLSTKGADSLAISWAWPFETEGNDKNDTVLGDLAANNDAATIAVTVTATVTQID